ATSGTISTIRWAGASRCRTPTADWTRPSSVPSTGVTCTTTLAGSPTRPMPNGHVTHFVYDARGRVTQKTALYGSGSPETTTYAYDETRTSYFNVGYQTTATNAAATIRYDHDKDGRLAKQ